MKTRTVPRSALPALALAVVIMACEQPIPNTPSPPNANPTGTTLEIVGPTSIPPGQPVQLSATLRTADGTIKSLVSATDVTWRSSNTALVQVSPTGLATAVGNQGEAMITVEYRIGITRTATREVVVQPAGTFRLVGTVTEEGAPGVVVPDARVELASGSPFAMTNAFGQYRLYGVPPQAEIRVSASEYDARTFSFQITENTTRNLAVPLIGSRPTLSGNYTVFIDAVACPSVFGRPPLPADLQHRAYEAVMTQTGAALDLKFTGGQFRTNGLNKGDGFKGSVIAGGARFTLDWYDFYYYPFYGPNTYPSVAERLPDGNYLVTTGTVNLTGTAGTGFTGTFTAQFSSLMNLFDANFPTSSRLLAGCSSGQTMRLIRR